MPNYLTRVVMAGAQTGDDRVRPVRMTAALPPTSVAASLPMTDEIADLATDVPRTASPATRVQRSADVSSMQSATAHPTASSPAEVAPVQPATARSNEGSSAEARGGATVEPPAAARLLAPHAETYVIRMPRNIRISVPQPAPEESAAGAGEPAAIIAAHEALVSASAERTTYESAEAEPTPVATAPAPHIEATGSGIEFEATPAVAMHTVAAAQLLPGRAPTMDANIARPQPVAPHFESAAASPAVVVGPAAESPRRRVTIGRLELQVQQIAPQQPPPIVRPPRLPVAPLNPIEGHFLDGLRWKL